jgi:hypothetical protein
VALFFISGKSNGPDWLALVRSAKNVETNSRNFAQQQNMEFDLLRSHRELRSLLLRGGLDLRRSPSGFWALAPVSSADGAADSQPSNVDQAATNAFGATDYPA